MISLPLDILNEFCKRVVFIKNLITLQTASRAFRWTDCDQNIYYAGQWYKSHPIKFDVISFGQDLEAASIKLTVSNVDKTFSRLALSENMQDKLCEIKRIHLTRNLSIIGVPIPQYYGYTDQIRIDKRIADIEIVDELIKWHKPCPARIHQDKCTWREFKGTECKYSGAGTWCDRSWGRCMALTVTEGVEGAVADDGGAQTNETTAANNDTTNDMHLTPDVPVTGDCYYFGASFKLKILMLNIATAASEDYFTIEWQYWNGASWTAIPGAVDRTLGFTMTGSKRVYLSPPADWAEKAIQGITSYWIRAVITVIKEIDDSFSPPKGTRAWVSDGQFLNFGGFRFVSQLQDKEIWWGRKQKSWANYASARQSIG